MRQTFAISLFCLLGACGAEDPNAELRALVAAAEQAAEQRDTGHFRALISDDYVDARGRRKQEVIDFVRGYFFVNQKVEVLTRVQDVVLNGDDAAELVLQGALIGRAAGSSVLGADGDLFRIELELVRERGDWRIIAAQWERILE